MKISMKINEIFPEITLVSIGDFTFSDLHFIQILDHDHIYTFSFLASIEFFCVTFGFPLSKAKGLKVEANA